MKQIKRIILYTALILFITGCVKDEAETLLNDKIIIEVEAPQTDGWSTDENVGTRGDETNIEKQEGEDGLDMETSTQPDIVGASANEVTTRWTNIDDNVVFRVVAYKCTSTTGITTSNYAGYGDYRLSGTAVQTIKSLALPMGTYTFICYSYGSSATIAAFTNSATSATALNGQNFMTCVKPNITINNIGSRYTLSNIVFAHQCVRYRILAKAQSERMGNITACSGTLTLPNNSASYSFTTNALTTNKAAGNLSISWSSLNAMNVYSNYIYILPVSSQNITISLNPAIGGKAFKNKSTTLSSLTFSKNKTVYSTISLTTTEGYIIRGAFWAGGNLYYDTTNKAFGINPDIWGTSIYRPHDFWRWGAYIPYDAFVSATTWVNDPCRSQGAWRLPSVNEFYALIEGFTGYTTMKDKNSKDIPGAKFDNMLFFPSTGYFPGSVPDALSTPARGLYWAQTNMVMMDFNTDYPSTPPHLSNSDHNDNYMAIRCVKDI